MTSFNGAQSFYIDPTTVSGSKTVDISVIGMYFMYRPSATNNKSGIQYPGITLFLTDVMNGVPNLANSSIYKNSARCEWNEIFSSSDASAETKFKFLNPITVDTGKSYAFCWSYDGSEDFLPWTNIKGNPLVGTTNISPGPSSPYGGSYFTFSGVNSNGSPSSVTNYGTAWTPLTGTDLKFEVNISRYALNTNPVSTANLSPNTYLYTSNLIFSVANGVTTITHPSPRVENISFDIEKSTKQAYVGSQRVYQSTVDWPGGGVWASISTNGSNTITANSQLSNGASFSWNTVFNGYTGDKFVVVDYGTSVDVRKVVAITSNTVIVVDEPTTATNSAAKFMLSAVGTIDSFNTSFLNGKKTSLMFLRDSSANSTVRFTGYSVDTSNVVVSNGGASYSNSNVLYVVGFQNVNGAITGNWPAVANLVTNSTGGVISLNWSNVGVGFVNSAAMSIRVMTDGTVIPNTSTANSAAGSNLSLIVGTGSTLMTEFTNNVFRNSRPVNIDVHTMTAVMNVAPSTNTTQYTSISFPYYLANNSLTSNGFVTYVGAPQSVNIDPNSLVYLNQLTNIPVVVSRSLEFSTLYSNGAPNDQASAVSQFSNNYYISLKTQSGSDYAALGPFYGPVIDFGHYIINNDYTGENTDSGNALARHITTTFSMTGPANTHQMAEDARIYLSAWRPPNTDIQVFTRIKNSTDSEAFIDEDWTRLKLVDGSNNFSTSGYVDLAYGFQGQPNTTLSLSGTATTSNGSSNLVGSNTTWSTQLQNNSLIKVYDPLFPNSNFAVCLVTNVVSNTAITIDQSFNTNTSFGIGGFELTGRGGLSVDFLGFGHQAFNNIQNENVVRYYNTSEHVYDGYDTLQVKCILLSPDPHFIPRIHNVRGVGVSA